MPDSRLQRILSTGVDGGIGAAPMSARRSEGVAELLQGCPIVRRNAYGNG